ncbi:T9SS type A sorting domain-containing protein [uncultured Psychroserpens sp.]|uniref:T9SS type A sorting domain-containing protein n=1 Tax=uncultured Psychroserpens sp. TaxID=255436 RepID=UPI002610689A|nr:T9SS type A sorting domain-containing protein [uncultured Psychroserpens sp.]
MKYFYFILALLFSCNVLQAQIVTIPDANFKNALVNTNCVDLNNDGVGDIDADTNNDGEIQESEAANIVHLYLINQSISSLEGISAFTALERLWCPQNNITNVDLSLNTALRIINCEFNQLVALDVTNNPEIIYIKCNSNQISDIDLSQNPLLEEFYISDNQITQLDISQNPNVGQLVIQDSNINAIFMKNGDDLNGGSFFIDNCPNLQFICVDATEIASIQNRIDFYGYTNCVINSYCTFEPGGEFFIVQGDVKIDTNQDGCDTNDLIYPNLKLNISDGNSEGSIITNDSGGYIVPLQAGTFTISPDIENASYFTISPESIAADFPASMSPNIQDFCITPNGPFMDLEIYIVPLTEARPGFDADYKMVYKNKGSNTISGTVEFNFDDFVVDFVSSNPSPDMQSFGSLEWNYANLQPYETRELFITMNFNTPTDPDNPVNDGDQIGFQSVINPISGDIYEEDNITSIKQTVVNSFDPNDKRCLEGNSIREAMVGEYVRYMIRFENTGTANAINVVIKDEIDLSTFDISTLIPLDASHNYITRIQNTNEVEFIFENIDLPFDDANNDGYVVFKIKTVDTLTVGDTFSNDAEIYFDFNFPIITNDFETTVEANLSVNEFEANTTVQVFPNPANDELHISSETVIDTADIYDVNGRLLQRINFVGNQLERTISIAHLAKGVYVIQLTSEQGELTKKVIKD